MGTFTIILGSPPKTQPSTTLISPIGKPAWKADPKDRGHYLQFCITKKGGSPSACHPRNALKIHAE